MAAKAAAGSMKERAEEQARYGGAATDDDKPKKDDKWEDYYEKTIQFECSMCGLCEMCQYLGRKPPFTKHTLEFTEDVYVMIDPFKPRQSRFNSDFLVLGGTCAACSAEVCQDCSVYFSKRFCIKCAQFNINEFPKDVQSRIVRQAGVLAARDES
jgi:hypothetical protein